jgi:uncharacterized membrane protein YqjE
MASPKPGPPGILASLRQLGDGLLGTVQDRIELIAVELQEEKFRLIQTCVWIAAAVFAGMMAITFASITVVYLFWESARLLVLGGLTAFYTAALAVILVRFRRFRQSQPSPFAATLAELAADRTCIRNET